GRCAPWLVLVSIYNSLIAVFLGHAIVSPLTRTRKPAKPYSPPVRSPGFSRPNALQIPSHKQSLQMAYFNRGDAMKYRVTAYRAKRIECVRLAGAVEYGSRQPGSKAPASRMHSIRFAPNSRKLPAISTVVV